MELTQPLSTASPDIRCATSPDKASGRTVLDSFVTLLSLLEWVLHYLVLK